MPKMGGKKEERTNSEEERFIIPAISSAVDSDTEPEENGQFCCWYVCPVTSA